MATQVVRCAIDLSVAGPVLPVAVALPSEEYHSCALLVLVQEKSVLEPRG